MPQYVKIVLFIALCLFLGVHPATAQTDEPGDERYKVYEDTMVVDIQLGLMWARRDNQGPIGWKNAYHYCRQGPPELLGQYKGWRMPTLRELAGLYSWSQHQDPIDTLCGKKIKAPDAFELTCDWFWSSKQKLNTSSAFNLRSGYVFNERPMNKTGYRALPVRNLTDKELTEIKRSLAESAATPQ